MNSLLMRAVELREACKANDWNVAAYIANMLVSEIANRLDLDPIERSRLGDPNIGSGRRSGLTPD